LRSEALGAGAMRNFLLILIAGTSLAGITPAAEKKMSFSGVWLLDPAHSELSHTPPGIRNVRMTVGNVSADDSDENSGEVSLMELPEARMQNLTLRIAHTDGELQTVRQFTIDGEKQAVAQKFLLDGSQCINVASNGQGEFVSRTTWKDGKLIHSGIQTISTGWQIRQGTEMSVKEEYSISKNGGKLTIKTSGVTRRGVTHLKQVFQREQEPKP
jgi:hypothetical protein